MRIFNFNRNEADIKSIRVMGSNFVEDISLFLSKMTLVNDDIIWFFFEVKYNPDLDAH